MSVAKTVREHVERLPVRSFLSRSDLPTPGHAVDCELARLAGRNELMRAHKGLYWKGPQTRAGMVPPAPLAVGMAVAGAGAGPAGFSAATALGLTTQVPSVEAVAVAGRAHRPPRGVVFAARSVERRFRELEPLEVAVIELMRDGTRYVEVSWDDVEAAVVGLVESEAVRPRAVCEQIDDEHHVAARTRWQAIEPRLGL